jgi:hypothetical protein
MNANKIYFYSFFSFFLTLISNPLYADNDLPSGYGDEIDPPPAAPIDNYLFLALIFCILYTGYYFFSKNKSLKKDN